MKFGVAIPTQDRDSALYYKRMLLDYVRNYAPELTVAGFDLPVVKHGVEYAPAGALITVGSASKHDVEWIRRPEYAAKKGVEPVLDLVRDWDRVKTLIQQYRREKYGQFTTAYGYKVTGNTRDTVTLVVPRHEGGCLSGRIVNQMITLTRRDLQRAEQLFNLY